MSPVVLQALPYLSAIFLLTWLVGSIPTWRDWHDVHLNDFISLSAGVLLATAFLHILPEAVEHGDVHAIGYGILAGFLFLFILEKFAMVHACEEHHCHYHSLGIAAFIGIGLHSFFDGVAMGTSFYVPNLAKAVFVAIVVHKMPSSFALASLFKAAKWPHRKIHLALAGFSLIIPASAFFSLLLLAYLPQWVVDHALNFSLGSFLYIATSDFLPQTHKHTHSKWRGFFFFALGIVLMGLFFSHHHDIH